MTFQADVSHLIRIQAKNAVLIAAAQSTKMAADVLNEYADNLAKATKNRARTMQKVYEKAGQAGQEAVLKRYNAKHGRSKAYRQNDSGKWRRYSNGALKEALASKEMWKATPSGLTFINPRFLDARAEQWAKLNFGAAPASQAAHRAAPMRFFGQNVPGFELGGDPGKAFSIPAGIFSSDIHAKTPEEGVEADKGKRFYPLALMSGMGAPSTSAHSLRSAKNRRDLSRWLRANGGTARRISKGIRGTRFLDAGVDEINKVLPKLVEDQIMTWLDEARKGVKSKHGKTIRVPGSGPLGRFQSASPQAISALNRKRFS